MNPDLVSQLTTIAPLATAALTIFGIVTYFFGKLIIEQQPWKENKTGAYVAGSAYLLIFIALPIIVAYSFLFEKSSWTNGIEWVLLVIILMWYVYSQAQAYLIQSEGWANKIKQLTNRVTTEKLTGTPKPLADSALNSNNTFFDLFLKPWIGAKAVFTANAISIVSVFYLLESSALLIYKIFAVICLIGLFSAGALIYSRKTLAPIKVKIITKEKPFEGVLKKIEDDWMVITQGAKVVSIAKKDVLYFERKAFITPPQYNKRRKSEVQANEKKDKI